MSRRFRSLAFLPLAGLVLLAPPAAAQAPEPAEKPPAGEDVEIESILEFEEEMLAGEGYTYDAAGRRDPFKSLLAARERPALRGPRPEGIPGLLIDEIDLTGIFLTSDGPVAQVLAADRDKSFLLRVGDQLYDGDVVDISASEVTFKQIVDDPTALKPFRPVVRGLSP